MESQECGVELGQVDQQFATKVNNSQILRFRIFVRLQFVDPENKQFFTSDGVGKKEASHAECVNLL